MPSYAHQLEVFAAREKELQEKKTQLIAKRKQEIAVLLEKYDLLTAPDTVLIGAFMMVADALKLNTAQVKQWEETCQLRHTFPSHKKRRRPAIKKNAAHTQQTATPPAEVENEQA